MAGGAIPIPATLTGAAILSRELLVDRATQAGVMAAEPVVDRPAGLQVLTAINLADLRRITGAAAFPMMDSRPSTFLSAR